MAKRLMIDLIKCRDCKECEVTCLLDSHTVDLGIKWLLELASFRFTCRRCEDAPCVAVCPAEALERNEEGIIERALNLCIACKSCVAICPFGTLMNQFFDIKQPLGNLCNIDLQAYEQQCVEACPKDALSFTEQEPDEKENIYLLNDNVLVREYPWEMIKTGNE